MGVYVCVCVCEDGGVVVVACAHSFPQRQPFCSITNCYFLSPPPPVQNILVDVHCNCEDIFQCPHEGESGYRVYISDFDSVLDVERTRKRLEKRSEMRLPVRYSVHGTPGYRPPEVSG